MEQLYQAIRNYINNDDIDSLEKIKELLDDGVNPNIEYEEDMPIIFYVITSGIDNSNSYEIAEILTSHPNFDPNIIGYPVNNGKKYTPLKYIYFNYRDSLKQDDIDYDDINFYKHLIRLFENDPRLTQESINDANVEKERLEEALDFSNNSFADNDQNSDDYDDDYDDDDYEIDYERLNFLNNFKINLHPPYEPFDIFDRNIFGSNNDFKIYDYIELENVPIKTYMKENQNNVVFFTLNKNKLYIHTGINRDVLLQQIDDNFYYYECEEENTGLRVTEGTFRSDMPYTQIRGDQGNLYIPVIQLAALLDSDHRYWLLDESTTILPYTTTLEMIDIGHGRNLQRIHLTDAAVNADHCQKGSDKKLYNLVELHPI